ncbi:DUF2231 domain-containing protein [Micromonospora endophytica]|uniref:Uncharacterized protein n=1 Tax=Micromonospora endophytica TaxID=515350 RepID=A0A2W2C2Q7_9ACTN|nr:DUF2231 domain-containing protein [Micromonospora endophytica]PZF93721.1 hypothetical protein C1I93_17570 [Micromonospora endophytica]RIW41759.1 DUF2231 domain-containing protein [Micromonospora endophytica]BCJ62960.1 hypothetical protein Jiend_63820 [Micromonospora endophytica]
MQSRLRVQGHPIQPMLVAFPYGLFVCATIFDLADVAGGPVFLGEVGYWTAVAALVTAGLTAAAGMVDLWDVPPDRTRRTAIGFNVVNAGMAGLFLLSCLVRAEAPNRGATAVLLVVEVFALAVGGVGVHLGARLMRHFEAGRAEAAGFDALRGGVDAPTIEVVRPRPVIRPRP